MELGGKLKEESYSRQAKLQIVLQKANAADYLLDHTQNFEGASRAYLEACSLLQFMICNTDDESYRVMLEAIWSSYMGRIVALQRAVEDDADRGELEFDQRTHDVSLQVLRPSPIPDSVIEVEEPEEYNFWESPETNEKALEQPPDDDNKDREANEETPKLTWEDEASIYSVSSTGSSVLTRASNIIQINYIPGVTNRLDHPLPSTPNDDREKGFEDGLIAENGEMINTMYRDTRTAKHTFGPTASPVLTHASNTTQIEYIPRVTNLSRPSTPDNRDVNFKSQNESETFFGKNPSSATNIQSHQVPRVSFASTTISETAISSHRITVDSFKTATTSRTTSTTFSFVSAVSAISLDRLGRSNSKAKIGRRFRDLLQRPNGGVHKDDSNLTRATISEVEPPLMSPVFNEHDWCGRGMHVDFADDEIIPLESIDFAGRGVTACVDIARCRRVRVARKIVKLPPSRRVTEQLLQEVRTLHGLSHAHIVRLVGTYIQKRNFATLLYPAAETNLEDYMQEVQEMHDTGRVEEIPQAKLLASREVLSKGALCLASGLRFLHKNRINHSDIKPANIVLKKGPLFFDQSYKMYFCDFGISRILDPEGESQTEEDRGKTPLYAAPEVMRWDPHGRAADIYSFGYVLAEMATVCSGARIEEFRNHIQDAPFKAYYKQYNPEKIVEFLLKCYPMGVPNLTISRMVNEDPEKRPRLVPKTYSDVMVFDIVFDLDCEHNHDGPAPFEIG